jgi:hypothetical protein
VRPTHPGTGSEGDAPPNRSRSRRAQTTKKNEGKREGQFIEKPWEKYDIKYNYYICNINTNDSPNNPINM